MDTHTEGRPTTQGTRGPVPHRAAPGFVTVQEFAAAWQRSPYQVRQWLKAGRVRGARQVTRAQGGRPAWEIPASALPGSGREIPSAGNRGGL